MGEIVINEASILRTGLLIAAATFIGIGFGLIFNAGVGYCTIGFGIVGVFIISG